MRIVDTVKNNFIEIIVIGSIIVGATSSVLITLYEMQKESIIRKYEADISEIKKEYETYIRKLETDSSETKKQYETHIKNLEANCSESDNSKCKYEVTSLENTVQEYKRQITELTSIKDDYEKKIKLLPKESITEKGKQPENKSHTANELISQNWEGNFTEYGHKEYPMVLYIERINFQNFTGKLFWKTFNNTITSVRGEVVKNFGDAVEQNKWRYIKGVNLNETGIWIVFTETALIQGGVALNGSYYAHISENKNMQGVYFREGNMNPAGDYFLTVMK